jgi:hypothetical protein
MPGAEVLRTLEAGESVALVNIYGGSDASPAMPDWIVRFCLFEAGSTSACGISSMTSRFQAKMCGFEDFADRS